MAFLDTTGSTIRIDAILTDEGRKKITQGTFKVTKFSLGDDEIDYSMYELDAESDKDTAILKTPLFEAFEGRTANIYSGLVSYGNKDLLWLPILKINDRAPTAAKQHTMPTGRPKPAAGGSYVSGTFFYMAANEETAEKLVDYFESTVGEGNKYVLRDSELADTKILIESGIDTGIPGAGPRWQGSRSNQVIHLIENGLVDNYFYISTDPRFIKSLYSLNQQSYFRTRPAGLPDVKLGPLVRTKYTTLAPPVQDKQNFISRGILNQVYFRGSETEYPCENISMFSGPRGSVTAFNFELDPELTTTSYGNRSYKYGTYGQINQYITNTTDKYDIIDIPVTIEGVSSARSLNIHIRLVRYTGE